jgi:transcriptional regulator with XRE-family HTH domain
MDIVSRLKRFISSQGIGSTQFADACRIPRPSLSQILSGRNKKISDEVIAKIHDAYPNLSVLWLLFGEGDMLVDGNIEFSEAQNGGIIDFGEEKSDDLQAISSDDGVLQSVLNFAQSGNSAPQELFTEVTAATAATKQPDLAKAAHAPEAGKAAGARSVVSIMVFYSDNSYQSFVPR